MKTSTREASTEAARFTTRPNPPAVSGERYTLKLCVLYHDDLTRAWAREVHTLARQLAGKESVETTWWNIRELIEPAVLAGAVSKAMHSDIIVVATLAETALPLAFYYWADAWLPHRTQDSGALVALIGVSCQTQAKSDGAREYLRILSRRGGLEFLFDERRLPAPSRTTFCPDPKLRQALAGAVLRTVAFGGGRGRSDHRFAGPDQLRSTRASALRRAA